MGFTCYISPHFHFWIKGICKSTNSVIDERGAKRTKIRAICDTGDLLARTKHNLEKSVTLHHCTLNSEEKEVLDDALTLAQQMEQGANADEDDLKNSLLQVNREIEKWNHEFEWRVMLTSHEPK